MKRPIRRWTISLATCLLGFVSSCTSVKVDYAATDAAVERWIGREVDAEAVPIESELRERGAAYVAEQPDEEGGPKHLAALLNVGEDALAARLHLIRSARQSVDLQVYVWADDLAGGLVFYEVLLAARRGVRVRLLLDTLANSSRGYATAIALAHENIQAQAYNPVPEFSGNEHLDFARQAARQFERLNERMHNKVLVVDDEVAIVGGRNIEDHYFDLDPEFAYLDRDLLVVGPVVADAARSFQDYWDHEITTPLQYMPGVSREIIALESESWHRRESAEYLEGVAWLAERAHLSAIADVLPHTQVHEVGRVAFTADPPEKDGLHYWNTWKRELTPASEALLSAQERIVLQSNYLLISHSSILEMEKLEARGVDLVFSTNSLASTANLLTYSGSRKQKLGLIHMGMDIRELRPTLEDVEHFLPRIEELRTRDEEGNLIRSPQIAIHAKSATIDDDVCIVGSHNFDPRSSLYNTEAMLTVWDEGLTRELIDEIGLLTSDGNSWICHHVDYRPVWTEFNEVMAGVSRALPILDIWPWRGYAMYELRDGQEPVDVDDPRFFERYRNVGELPEVDSRNKEVKTRLLTTIIAPLWNLL